MKIRRIPFNLKKAMNIGSNFNFNWAFDKETSILGLGYSFYLEHIEYFCNFVRLCCIKPLKVKFS